MSAHGIEIIISILRLWHCWVLPEAPARRLSISAARASVTRRGGIATPPWNAGSTCASSHHPCACAALYFPSVLSTFGGVARAEKLCPAWVSPRPPEPPVPNKAAAPKHTSTQNSCPDCQKNAASEDRTHDPRSMRPRYSRLKAHAFNPSGLLLPLPPQNPGGCTSALASARGWRLRALPMRPRIAKPKPQKTDSILRTSQAPPRTGANRALCRLTAEVGRDRMRSARSGRQRVLLSYLCWRRRRFFSLLRV